MEDMRFTRYRIKMKDGTSREIDAQRLTMTGATADDRTQYGGAGHLAFWGFPGDGAYSVILAIAEGLWASVETVKVERAVAS
jgi:hypothetical protein